MKNEIAIVSVNNFFMAVFWLPKSTVKESITKFRMSFLCHIFYSLQLNPLSSAILFSDLNWLALHNRYVESEGMSAQLQPNVGAVRESMYSL